MNTHIKKLIYVAALTANLGLMPAGRLGAQTFTTLYNFSTHNSSIPQTNSDGAFPTAGLTLSGNTLYGTAAEGGSSGNGTVFGVNTDGTGFTNLHTFAGTGDGSSPYAQMVLVGSTLYGTAYYGNGFGGNGTVFGVNINGTDFTPLTTLPSPQGLILSGDTLYGAAGDGGNWSSGRLFTLSTDGSSLATVYPFTAATRDSNNYYINSDGAFPVDPPVLAGDTLYGTAGNGGAWGNGTVFKVNTNGTGFTVLHTFTAVSDPAQHGGTNSDGAIPGAVILLGNTLYGTTQSGGSSSNGTVFAVNTDGSGFTVLHAFTATSGPDSTNSDGANPAPGLTLSGSTLYGTALNGGSYSNGTVFAVNTDGSDFTVLHSFTARSGPNSTNSDGSYPYGGLIFSDNTLYGTAEMGGSGGSGTVYSLTLPPVTVLRLTITLSGTNVILSWPTNAAGLALQSTPSLVPPVGWTGVPSNPIVVNGLNIVTNPMSGDQQFYQLVQPVIGN